MSTEIITFDDMPINLLPTDYTEAALNELTEKCTAAKIHGINDKEGLNSCKAMRQGVRKLRSAVEKRRKEAKAGALEYGRKLDAEAKRITAVIMKGEQHLTKQIEHIESEKQRIKEEKRKAEQERIDTRIGLLSQYVVSVNAQIPALEALKVLSDEKFEQLLLLAKNEFEAAEAERKKLMAEAEAAEQARVEAEQKAAELQKQLSAKADKEADFYKQKLNQAAKLNNDPGEQAQQTAVIYSANKAPTMPLPYPQAETTSERKENYTETTFNTLDAAMIALNSVVNYVRLEKADHNHSDAMHQLKMLFGISRTIIKLWEQEHGPIKSTQ